MRHLLLAMAPSSSQKKPTTAKPGSATTANVNHHHANSPNCPSLCRHSPSATLDILIFIIVLFSGAFLIISYFSYLFQAFSLLLPPFSAIVSELYYYIISDAQSQYLFFGLFLLSFAIFVLFFEICYGFGSKRCGKNGCKGLKKAMEFDLQLQGEELLRSENKAVKDVNELPWKGDCEDNPDYECLRAELRKMAPPNGRAVLLFRAKCGCPVAKLEGWGPKRGRRHKKTLALTGGGDNR
ncbi:uncharacterized protein At5g19025-like [Olea europaea var. sylvestris]|uniref:Uncharacterized protein At5g19025-like n=1 Tax=Olea europaea subsp. europaea TaxID=158383 RepID=A0A8S0PBX9_OLEEU|nr:uncharacterized protein At5g19025-like [Olea europaea var. sylvestris]CAA2938069.1 uncharacterized protein At5g19025-like [Olea europaea subsp. europaea]